MWPESPAVIQQMMVEDQNSLTTLEPFVMKEQGGLVTAAFIAVSKLSFETTFIPFFVVVVSC